MDLIKYVEPACQWKKESANLKMLEQKFGSVKCVIVPNVSLIYKI